jgi:hypothetical protein
MNRHTWIGATLGAVVAMASWVTLATGSGASAQEGPGGAQSVLGPGLYVFQTRTRTASCADDERTGYVSSFFASIHGVPGSRRMSMGLVNSPYWSTWTLTVGADDSIAGDSFLDGSSGPSRPTSHFVVTRRDDRFTGEGTRTYDAVVEGTRRRCVVTYDALLRRIDG